MPKNKKPRKLHRRLSFADGLRQASALSRILIKGDGYWLESDVNRFAGDFLEPLAAIRYSKAADDLQPYFGLAKSQLVFAYGLSSWVEDESQRAAFMREIEQQNQLLQMIANTWLNHRRILYPQLKHLRRLAASTFEDLVEYFPPSRISTQRYAMGKGAQYYDAAEDLLDSKLKFKEMNYV